MKPTHKVLSLALLLLFLGCSPRVPVAPPYDPESVNRIVSALRQGEEMVRTLISSGSLTIRVRGSSSDATALIVAVRDPFKLKVEITHTWGRPLLHILITDRFLDIVSFTEKRLYTGYVGTAGPQGLIPIPLSREILWTLARAYPVLPKYSRAVSLRGNRITLLGKGGDKLQVIDLHPESGLPRKVVYCEQDTEVRFLDFKKAGGVRYAGQIEVYTPREEARIRLEINQMTFNRPVPDAIFNISAPPDFELVPISSVDWGH